MAMPITIHEQGRRQVRLSSSTLVLIVSSLAGLGAFLYPFILPGLRQAQDENAAHSNAAPLIFAGVTVLCLVATLVTISDEHGGVGRSKTVALLGMLVAIDATLRLVPSMAGASPVFLLMILVGAVFGASMGFQMGALTILLSAFITGGIGPWLPFQMLAMGWVTMGAGLLPGARRLRGRAELALVAGYGAVTSLGYGLVMNLQAWPYLAGMSSGISFVPGDPLPENLGRYLTYVLTTSLGWDVPRALLTAGLVLLCGGTVLRALRRATRRAAFDAEARFTPSGRPPS